MSDTHKIDNDDSRDPIERLAEAFLLEHRDGRSPTIDEFAQRYPDYAEDIREVFPALVTLENLGKQASGKNDAVTERETALELPEQLGDYRILRRIGQGGMGTVYAAHHETLDRDVAIKVLPRHSALDPQFVERFRREARAAAGLHHTNIVPIFDVGDAEGNHYLAMQLITGVGLDRLLHNPDWLLDPSHIEGGTPDAESHAHRQADVSTHNQRIDPTLRRSSSESSRDENSAADSSTSTASRPRAIEQMPQEYYRKLAQIGIESARALGHVHRHGYIHRDIKPSNILYDRESRAWMTDFGLAKAHDAESNLTRTGGVVGTVRYLAPERLNGECTPLSDIYGLGVTLYELSTGRPAFPGSDRMKLLHQICNEAPTLPQRINPNLPDDLQTIIMKAAHASPKLRYATADDLADDLQRWLNHEPIRAKRTSMLQQVTLWTQRRPLVAALLLIITTMASIGLPLMTWKWLDADRAYNEASENYAAAEDARELAVQHQQTADEQRLAAEQSATELQKVILQFYLDVSTSAELLDDNPNTLRLRNSLMSRAQTYYLDYLDQFGDKPSEATLMAYLNLGDIQSRSLQWSELEETCERCLALIELIHSDQMTVEELDHARCHCYFMLGESYLRTDRNAEAEEPLWLAYDLSNRLIDDFGESAEYFNDRSMATKLIAQWLLKTGEREQALTRYVEAIDDLTRADAMLSTANSKHALATMHASLAEIADDGTELPLAMEHYTHTIRLREELAAEYEHFPTNDYRLSQAYYGRGRGYWSVGQRPLSVADTQRSVEVSNELANAYPKVAIFQDEFGKAVFKRGQLRQSLGETDLAEQDVLLALSVYEKIAGRDGAEFEHRLMLTSVIRYRGEMLLVANQPQAALESIERARTLQAELYEEADDHATLLYEFGQTHMKAATIWQRYRDFEKALPFLEEALRLLERLNERYSGNSQYMFALASAHNAWATVHFHLMDYESAVDGFEPAIELLQELTGRNPRSERNALHLGQSYNNIGSCFQILGEFDRALTAFDEAIEIRQSLCDAHPDSLNHRTNYYGTRVNMSLVYRDQGDLDQCLEFLNDAETGLQQIVDEQPSHTTATSFLRTCRYQLGETLRQRAWHAATTADAELEDRAQALTDIRRAIELSSAPSWLMLDCLAACYAANDDFENALESIDQAIEAAPPEREGELQSRKETYESHNPLRLDQDD